MNENPQLPTGCPTCGAALVVIRKGCPGCGTQVSARFGHGCQCDGCSCGQGCGCGRASGDGQTQETHAAFTAQGESHSATEPQGDDAGDLSSPRHQILVRVQNGEITPEVAAQLLSQL